MDDASRPPDFGLAKTLIAIGYVECLGLVKDARARRALALRLQQDGYGALNSIADVARQMAFSTQRVKQFIAMALDDVCDCMKEIEAMVAERA